MAEQTIPIDTDWIRLGDCLKLANLVGTGGMAKQLIQDGIVRVNGEVDTRRGRKLRPGDVVSFGNPGFPTLRVTGPDA